jgi:hypothetical protein
MGESEDDAMHRSSVDVFRRYLSAQVIEEREFRRHGPAVTISREKGAGAAR